MHLTRVDTRTGKPGKMGRHFPFSEKSVNFEQTGKVGTLFTRVHTQTGKPGKMGRHFPFSEKSVNFEQTGTVGTLSTS